MSIQELQKQYLPKIAPEDFFVLLSAATEKDKTYLFAHPEYRLDEATETQARDFFSRRLQHEPVAYIIGHKQFYGRDFIVTPDTLIPRPETEHIVELTCNEISKSEFQIPKKSAIIDIGTGSGNIIISIAKEILDSKDPVFDIPNTQCSFLATDISSEAVAVAKENAKRHDVDNRISFHEGDLLEPIFEELSRVDEVIIAANLPYLSDEIYASTPKDVHDFEPRNALWSSKKGLDHYFRLLDQTKSLFKKTQRVTLFLEISPEQSLMLSHHVKKLLPEAKISTHQDLTGRERIVEIQI